MRITHHDGALGTPEKTSTDTEKGTGEDQEADIFVVVVRQKRGDVEEIPKTTDKQGQLKADPVGDGAGEETDNGKSTVQGGVGIANILRVDLATAAQTADSVEHAWTEEADEGNKHQLDLWRREPGQGPAADLQLLVHPRLAHRLGILCGLLVVGRRDIMSRGFVNIVNIVSG